MTSVHPSTLLARLAVEALRVAGVRHVVLCPGSRSAPLAYALAAGDVDLRVRHDEDDEPAEFPVVQPPATPEPPAPSGVVDPGPRTVVVAGDGADTGLGPQAREVALAAGWPLLAEPSSGAAGPDAVAAYRLLLEMPELVGAVERAVVYGRPTLSRPVTRLLERPDVDLALVAADGDWPNP